MGGIVGPVAFVTAWAFAGARASGYSSVDDAISRLAAVHASTRVVMTAGFIVFGVGVALFAVALRRVVGGSAWVAALASGLCTLAVAAFPLDAGVDSAHGASAVLGYITLAATPVLASRGLARQGNAGVAAISLIVGGLSAALLGASFVGPANGLFQRAGLGVTDVWICAAALAMVRMRSDIYGARGRTRGTGPTT